MISERRWNPKGKWEVPYSEDSIAKLQFLRILLLILIFIPSHPITDGTFHKEIFKENNQPT